MRVRLQCFQQGVVFGRRADGDAQAVGEQRMPAIDSSSPECPRPAMSGEPVRASGTRTSRKLACVGNTVTPAQRARARLQHARARARIAAACSASRSACRQQYRHHRLRQRVDVVRRTHLCPVRRSTPDARPHSPAAAPAMPTFDSVRTTIRLGNSSTRGRNERVGERVVRLVDGDQPRRRADDAAR